MPLPWVLTLFWLVNFALPAAALEFDPKHIYQRTAPAVVLIAAFDPGQEKQSLGTGSIISPDGLILTNAHILSKDLFHPPYKNFRVFLKPPQVTGNIRKDTVRKFKASLINYSNFLDLAVLKIQGGSPPFPHLSIADSNHVEIGDPVLAIGHPEQGGLWTLTTGTISSQIENFSDTPGKHVFQTETSLNKGNSGGPLINRDGTIVGINSEIARKNHNGLAITDINFSIKSNVALTWLNTVGFPFSSARIKTKQPQPLPPQTAGIIPVEKPKIREPFSAAPPVSKSSPVEPEILTDPHPLKMEDLRKQVETEMEDLMEEMRNKLQNKRPGTINRDPH